MTEFQLENHPIAAYNADPKNWTWPSQKRWCDAPGVFQTFNTDHRKLAQEDWGTGETFSAPFDGIDVRNVLVRASYRETFDAIWNRACSSVSVIPPKGYIITGQPGIGKSLFLYYVLIRLLRLQQPVLFSDDGESILLFFHEKVYELTAGSHRAVLPVPSGGRGSGFLWSLFDIEALAEPSNIFFAGNVCPIQAASPNSARFHQWRKQYVPKVIYFPLWKKSELLLALPLQPFWRQLKQALEKRASNPEAAIDLDIAPALRKLKPRPQLPDDHPALVERFESQIEELIDRMIHLFGYIARDVFSAIRAYNDVELVLNEAITPDDITFCFQQITTLDHRLAKTPPSHRLFAVEPVGDPFSDQQSLHDDGAEAYQVVFKSEDIKLRLLGEFRKFEEAQIRRLTSMTRAVQAAAPLAGDFFENLAHRILCAPSSAGKDWSIVRMIPEPGSKSTFCLAEDTSTPPSSQSFQPSSSKESSNKEPAIFKQTHRPSIAFSSSVQLPKEMKHEHYYLPTFPNLPLIDSFTVDIDTTCVLWLLQMTITEKHKGKKSGYPIIRDIIRTLNQTSGKQPIVRYLLVVPNDRQSYKWQFDQEGWVDGEVYCLKLDL